MFPKFRVVGSHIWYDSILEVDLDVGLEQVRLLLADPPEPLRETLYDWVQSSWDH